MKKSVTRARRKKNRDRYHKMKHQGKLLILLTSKLFLAFISFLIGLVIGNVFASPPILILIAFAIGIIFYLISVLHIIKWLKI